MTGAASAQALAQVLAEELTPAAVVIDADLGSTDGMAFLLSLKRNLATRHIPVSVLSAGDQRQPALSAGALNHVEKPVTRRALDEALGAVSSFLDRPTRQLLVVEDDTSERTAICELLGTGGEIVITEASSSEEAIAALEQTRFDCMVLDLKLPKASCVAVLDAVTSDSRLARLPVVGYAAKDLTHREEAKIRKYAETVVLKSVGSHERLLDEATLFLHRSAATMPEDHRRILDELHHADVMFAGKRVLVVDDDVRNVFALTSALEGHGMEVVFAENGRDGLEMLNKHPDVDLVLMDIMMPEMDGYQTTRAIRSMPGFRRLPVIALTAKAMKEDRDKSIAAGASDYIAKPVAIDQLLSLMRVWLHR